MRALLETLSRLDRHRDVAALLGALAASSRATDVSGADWRGWPRSSGPPVRDSVPSSSHCGGGSGAG